MPANYVKTVRQLLYYQYAKIISESAHWGKTNYGMITTKYKQLLSGEIHWSSSVREWLKEKEIVLKTAVQLIAYSFIFLPFNDIDFLLQTSVHPCNLPKQWFKCLRLAFKRGQRFNMTMRVGLFHPLNGVTHILHLH